MKKGPIPQYRKPPCSFHRTSSTVLILNHSKLLWTICVCLKPFVARLNHSTLHWTICVWLKPFVNVCVNSYWLYSNHYATEQPTVRYHASTILSYMVSISVNKLYISLVDLVGCVTLSKKFSYRCSLTEQTKQVKSTATNVMAFTACTSTLQVLGTFALISIFWQPKKIRNYKELFSRNLSTDALASP